MSAGDFGKEGRFSDVRKANQSDISQKLELEIEDLLNARHTVFGDIGCSLSRTLETGIATSATSAFDSQVAFSVMVKIG